MILLLSGNYLKQNVIPPPFILHEMYKMMWHHSVCALLFLSKNEFLEQNDELMTSE